MTNKTPTGEQAQEQPRRGGPGGLIAILVAILLGVLIGVFYGRTMWMASEGPATTLDTLQKTLVQKEEFATERDKAASELSTSAEQVEAELRLHAENADGNDAAQDALRRKAEQLRDAARALRQESSDFRDDKLAISARIRDIELLQQQAEQNKHTFAYRFAALFAELTKFVGELFLQVLKLLVIPLVVTSMICGITSLGDVRKIGKVGWTTIVYYLSTMAVAVVIGIVLVLIIRPGLGADDTFSYITESVKAKEGTTILETVLNVFRGSPGREGDGMFPSNIFLAATQTNVLALIVFAIVFGAALTTVGERGRIAIGFFEGANEAVMKMVHLVMFFAPVGIYGLVAWNIAKNGGGDAFFQELARLSKYVVTVLAGLALHSLFLAGVLVVFARRNPIKYIYGILRALLTAMTTASSSASLPVTIECVEENNGVSNRAASFVLPLGATVNMDGTALYEAVAVIFIAQSAGMTLGIGQLLIIFFTATLAAVGAAGIPEAGLVTMMIVLQAAGVPISGIGTILAIDWFLDRMRTTVNVYGDAVGAAVVDEQVISKSAA